MAWEGIEHPITVTEVKFAPGQRVKYVPNNRSFGAFMRSDQMRDVTEKIADDIAVLAKKFSPMSTRGGNQTGLRMRDQFKVVRDAGFIKVGGNVRVLVLVVNEARSAAPNEFGTSKNKAHRMLARAAMEVHPTADFKPEGGGFGRGGSA